MKLPVVNSKGLVVEEVSGEALIFGQKNNEALFSQAVRVFLSNKRKARAITKGRSDVIGGGAKIWRQKGTGRARHGNDKAPLFVGGGVAHGPSGEQNYRRKLNQKMIKKATFSVLSEKLSKKKLFLVKDLQFAKTKEAAEFIKLIKKELKLKEKIVFLIVPGEEILRTMKNIKGVTLLDVNSLNPYLLSKNSAVLITEKAFEKIKTLVGKKESVKNVQH